MLYLSAGMFSLLGCPQGKLSCPPSTSTAPSPARQLHPQGVETLPASGLKFCVCVNIALISSVVWAVATGTRAFVHGGLSNFVLDDLYAVDLSTGAWSEVGPCFSLCVLEA